MKLITLMDIIKIQMIYSIKDRYMVIERYIERTELTLDEVSFNRIM